MVEVVIHKPPEKWEGLKRTFSPKDGMITKDKKLFSVCSGVCLPCIFVSKTDVDPDVISGATFHWESNIEKGNEILV